MKNVNKKKIGYLLLFLLFSSGAVFFITISFSSIYNIYRSKDWKETPAKILTTDIEIKQGSRGKTYKVFVEYQYVVSNEIFKGNTISFGYSSGIRKKYENAVYEFFKNANTINIFVNPNNPSESVIVKGFSDDVFSKIFFAIGFGIFALFFLIALFLDRNIIKKVGLVILSLWILGLIILYFVHIPIENKIVIVN